MAGWAALLTVTAVSLLLWNPARRRASSGHHTADPAGAAAQRGASTPDRSGLLRIATAAGAGLGVWLIVPGSWAPAAAGLAAAVTWQRSATWESASARRHRARLEEELPQLVDLLVAALQAGLAPGEALDRVAAVCPPTSRTELQVPLARLRLGADPVAVWSDLSTHPQLSRLGITLRRATESGAPVAEALGRLAEELRANRRGRVEAQVRRIEVRAAVPLGVCLLPSFVLTGVVPLVAGSALAMLGG